MQIFTRYLQRLTSFGERQGEKEILAAEYIYSLLAGIHPVVQPFTATIPHVINAELLADTVFIPCEGVSLSSGTITHDARIVPVHITASPDRNIPSITYSPYTKSIARTCLFVAPALAIGREFIQYVQYAKKVKGKIIVQARKHNSSNILVGNTIDPHVILFAHYDSIGPGAVDNAVGVALLLEIITSRTTMDGTVLYVFVGNEELSYDSPISWGHGYRIFQEEYAHCIISASQIVVIDSVGQTAPHCSTDRNIVTFGFPIQHNENTLQKTAIIHGDIQVCDRIYHSPQDTVAAVQKSAVQKTKNILRQYIGA